MDFINNLDDLKEIIETDRFDSELFKTADKKRREIYGDEVYIRGLIEITNYCKNNCFYCGIRKDNKNAVRYRLEKNEILECAKEGYALGFRTFVLQGGEDGFYDDKTVSETVFAIREKFPDCAVTLSLGEKKRESYAEFFRAGASRYLLRHETADEEHYKKLHPQSMSLKRRKQCLFDLKEIGYQVGSGFMVGSPWQTTENIMSDLQFLRKLSPDMIGIGPYITHKDTPFCKYPSGDFDLTLRMIAILRIIFPYALIPATTALATISPDGRERGLKAGANVVMPNLSPVGVRKFYELYENKICTGEEAAQSVEILRKKVESAGYRIVTDIGNVKR